MLKYIVRRIVLLIPVLLGAIFLVFALCRLAPGDPVLALLGTGATEEQIQKTTIELGLDKGFFAQFWNYLKGIVTELDFGTSYSTKLPVSKELLSRWPFSIKLGFSAMLLAAVLGIPAGILSAVKQYSPADYTVTVIAMFFASMPGFWLSLMLMLIFALQLGLFPASGIGTWRHMVLPVLACGLGPIASICRTTRSSMLEVIRQDYIRTARAKGVSERAIIFKHALKNALIPVITVVGNQLGHAMTGSMIVESIFTLPGLGNLLVDSINTRNYPVIQGCVIVIAISVSVVTMLVDLIYAYIDPRVKALYSGGGKKKRKGSSANAPKDAETSASV